MLLLDEPFNALDAKLRLTMQVELRKLIERVGITSIFVTHDQAEAMTLSDSVAVMRGGDDRAGRAAARDLRPPADGVCRRLHRPRQPRARDASRGGRIAGLEGIAAPGPTARERWSSGRRTLTIAGGRGPGWRGTVAFATALGPTSNTRSTCGLAEPLRVVAPRRAGGGMIGAGTRRARRHRRTRGGALRARGAPAMTADAVLPQPASALARRVTRPAAAFGRPCRRWSTSFVFMVLPMATLLLFGFVTIDRGSIVGDSFTLEHLARALQRPAGLAADVAQLLGRGRLDLRSR